MESGSIWEWWNGSMRLKPNFKGEWYDHTKLINAAPDLLEALLELVHLHQCEQEGLTSGQPSPEQWYKAVNKAEEAIKKATE